MFTGRRRPSQRPSLVWASAAAVLAALAVATAHWTETTRGGDAPRAPAAVAQNGTSLGRADAAVTIEVFSDFLCGHCGDFALSVEPAIVNEFIATDKARLVYRHFPIVSPGSATVAAAAECAADQGRFWDYHNAVFARAAHGGVRSQDDVIAIARSIGLDDAPFARCLRSGDTLARVEADRNEGQRRGVTGTPTTFVNGRMISGAVPVEVLREAIVDALAR
jgi:protein-disulfide isomerase